MKALSIRAWFLLLLLAMVATPILAAALAIALRPPLPPARPVPALRLEPALAAAVRDNVARWADPAWQRSLAPMLAAADADVVLLDPSGRVVYRSDESGAETNTTTGAIGGVPADLAARPAAALVVSSSAGAATAVFAAHPAASEPPAPEPPWRRNPDFWLIPAVQVAALLTIAAAVALFVSRAFLRPLATMIDGMRQIESGNLDIRLPTSRVAEVAEVAAAFGAMADALRDSLERQDELEQERRMTISAVIHDLRTPLFALRGYLEGLAAGIADSPEKAARYLQLSRDKADALDRLVTDLFAYARTEYLEEAPRRERLDLSDLLTRTVEGMQPRADAKGVRLRLTGADA
ncbi:MAG TPA: HAMP domain-containing protein, partial [Thermomicrobiales bacterium]|nr:HAMP domain-containing protein [Thermomicrobiales bacterium]